MNCSIDEGYDDGVSEEDDSFTYYIDDVTIIPKDVPPEQALMMNTTSLNDVGHCKMWYFLCRITTSQLICGIPYLKFKILKN